MDKKVEKLEKQLTETNKKLEDMEHLVNQLVGAIEELGTKRIILPKEEAILPDMKGLPERIEIEVDEGGKEIAKEFKKRSDKILEDKE